jgi:uncharacterized repeat protein (TIGR02543 family)
MDADGATLVAAAYVGRLYHSADSGVTWTELRPVGDVDRNWQAVAVDADGFHIVAAVDGGSVWTSSDGGATWSDAQPAGVTAAAWQCCASSTDGSRLIAGAYQGRLYTGLATWSLSYACAAGGVIAGTTSQTVNYGASGTSVTAVPHAGYHFVSWSDASTVNPRTDTNVTADIAVTATFAVDTFAITASAGANGAIDPSGSVSVNYGSTQSFTINPSTGYHVLDVLVDGSTVGAVPSCTFTNVTANHTIAASFAITTYTLTVNVPGSGSVAKSPDRSSYTDGTWVQLTATPATGYTFTGWSGDLTDTTTNPATVTMDANKVITASFAIDTFTVTPSTGSNGSISPSTLQTIDYGSNLTFTMTPNTGYHVSSVLVDGAPATLTAAAYTFTNVTAGHTIAATFAVDTFVITVISGFHGTVTPGTGLLPCHADQAYVVKPDAGHMIDTLTVDGVVVNEATNRLGYTVTLTSIEDAHTIVATFTSIPDLTAPVNDVPSFTKGADQTVLEDCGLQTVARWATSISTGPADEAGQAIDFIVTNDNTTLFSTQPALAANGTLTYTPAANGNGTATVTVSIHDNGRTTSGGVDTSAPQTFTITVNPCNDAPVNTVRPSIDGNLFVNREVHAVIGNWNDNVDFVPGHLTYTYQWLRARDAAGTGLVLIPGAIASTYAISPIDEGMYIAVCVTCTDDGEGLPVSMSTSVDSAFLPARYLDITPPTIELPDFSSWPGVTGMSGGTAPSFTVNRSPFDLQFMVEDNLSSVQWKVAVNGVEASSSVGTGTIDRSVSLTEGTNRVDSTAVDQAGNRAERRLTITLDTHAPEVVLPRPLTRMVTGTTLNVEGTISDELSGVRSLRIDGTEVIPYLDGTFTVSLPLKRGLNTIAVETLDNAGNHGSFTWVVGLIPVQQQRARRTIDLTIDSAVMVVDGASVTMDVAPLIREDRTLLPFRALVEELGGSIAWNAKTRQVTVKARGVTMVLTIGKNSATVNGKSILIDAANKKVVPIILGSRTFLPLRFAAEQLGLDIAWYAPTRTVTITWEP